VPFVQALGLDPSRLIPVTRGGAGSWYGTPTSVELYDLREPKAIRIENALQHARTGMLKQNRVTPFDRAILKDAAKAAGLTKYHVLHPSWMYTLLRPFWEGKTGLEWVWPYLTRPTTQDGQTFRAVDRLTSPQVPDGLKLPPRFVAARFYLRATFPYSDATLQAARTCIQQVASADQPVILLNAGVHADEHLDLELTGLPHVYRLKDLCVVEPRTNLALQTAVLNQAQGFLGTYGGLAQLALRLGKPSVSFYWHWQGTALAHKHLSEALALHTGVPFLTVRLADAALLRTVLPEIAFNTSSGGQQMQYGPPKNQAVEPPAHEDASVA
jgi:hypothetical protein